MTAADAPTARAAGSQEPRVVVVTGATGETGRATCAVLLARGEHVVAVGRDASSLESLRAALGEGVGTDVLDRLDTRVCDLLDGDAVLPDEFPLSMFYEALSKKMKGVIESTAGITGASA